MSWRPDESGIILDSSATDNSIRFCEITTNADSDSNLQSISKSEPGSSGARRVIEDEVQAFIGGKDFQSLGISRVDGDMVFDKRPDPDSFTVVVKGVDLLRNWLRFDEKDNLWKHSKSSGQWVVNMLVEGSYLPPCFVRVVKYHSSPVGREGRRSKRRDAQRKWDMYKELICSFRNTDLSRCQTRLYVTASVKNLETFLGNDSKASKSDENVVLTCLWSHDSDKDCKSGNDKPFCSHHKNDLARGVVRKTGRKSVCDKNNTAHGMVTFLAEKATGPQLLAGNVTNVFTGTHAASQASFRENEKTRGKGVEYLLVLRDSQRETARNDYSDDPKGLLKFFGQLHSIQLSNSGDLVSAIFCSPRSIRLLSDMLLHDKNAALVTT